MEVRAAPGWPMVRWQQQELGMQIPFPDSPSLLAQSCSPGLFVCGPRAVRSWGILGTCGDFSGLQVLSLLHGTAMTGSTSKHCYCVVIGFCWRTAAEITIFLLDSYESSFFFFFFIPMISQMIQAFYWNRVLQWKRSVFWHFRVFCYLQFFCFLSLYMQNCDFKAILLLYTVLEQFWTKSVFEYHSRTL